MYGQKKNITYIEDLPELEDLEGVKLSNNFRSKPQVSEKYKKYIRNTNMNPPTQSGMVRQPYPTNNFNNHNVNNNSDNSFNHYNNHPQNHYNKNIYNQPGSHNESGYDNYNQYTNSHKNTHMIEKFSSPESQSPQCVCNCLDIAKHIENCPICSKFYKRDNTLYIIIIVILSIICVLLIKKVLNL